LYSPHAPAYEPKFSVEAPAIEATARDNAQLPVTATYDARVVEDEFTITV
jgi:hypothetical protein